MNLCTCEKEQGTLEPILITPISREEFLIGKALAAVVPAVAVAYFVFGIFLLATLSQSFSASSKRCVVKNTVIPLLLRFKISS